MPTHAITDKTNAATTYSNYSFDSFCVGPDGTKYGIKSDGLYTLTGNTDNGTIIAASVALGTLNFGTSSLKRCDNIYLGVDSTEPMVVSINGYEYETRNSNATMMEQRADVGKGIRANFFELAVSNKLGSDFNLESLEVAAVITERRI